MNIKIARTKKKMNQIELCDYIGISRATLSKLENGNLDNLTYPLMIKIAKALDTTVQELFLSNE